MKKKTTTKDDWVSLAEASRQTGYDKGRLCVLAKEGRIRSRHKTIQVLQAQHVCLVRLSDILKHREQAKPGPKTNSRRLRARG